MDEWVGREFDGGELPDQRLKSRPAKLLGDLGRRIGATVPMARQDWAATKAAYRSFSNRRVDEGLILAGHFAATRARSAQATGPTLILHDTTEFSFTREYPEAIGRISIIEGRRGSHTVCGLLMHSSLVLTSRGVPLGLAAVKSRTREEFKGTNAPKKTVNPTRIPIEQKESVGWLEDVKRATERLADPSRCVHIGDREGNIFEPSCTARGGRDALPGLTRVDRLAGGGDTTISREMGREPIRGDHQVEIRDDQGRVSTAKVSLRFRQMRVHPPIGESRHYPASSPTVIHAQEDGPPEGREPIRWKSPTSQPVEDLAPAIEKLDWHS